MTPSQTTAIAETAARAANDQALGLTTYPRFIKAEQSVPGWTPYVKPTKPTMPTKPTGH